MKTKQPVPDDKEQYKRFLETAEKIKADNDKELFKQVCVAVFGDRIFPLERPVARGFPHLGRHFPARRPAALEPGSGAPGPDL